MQGLGTDSRTSACAVSLTDFFALPNSYSRSDRAILCARISGSVIKGLRDGQYVSATSIKASFSQRTAL